MLFYSSRSAVATTILFLDDEDDRRREEGGRGHAWYEGNAMAIMRDKRMRNEKMDGKEEARGGRQMENNNIDV